MKGDELRARRNFHVSKRIKSRLNRQYGITLDQPTARDTVPPIIDSLRRSRNNTQRDLNVSPPVEKLPPAVPPRTLQNRKTFLQGLKCVSKKTNDASRFPEEYESWLTDDYLFAQIGPISSGTQVRKQPAKHPECDEPECGTSGWLCDLCQEVDLTYEPLVLEEAVTLLPSASQSSDIIAPKQYQHESLDACPIIQSLRALRRQKKQQCEEYFVPELFDEPVVICQSIVSEDSLPPAFDDLADSPLPAPIMDSSDECLFVIALVLYCIKDLPLSQSPGLSNMAIPTSGASEAADDDCVVSTVDAIDISVYNGQNFVFDRGKCCPCVLWMTRVHTPVVT